MYSQNTEEEVILNYFKGRADGLFAEVGAFDPKVFSNTRALVELGWGGIYIEPVKEHVEKFKAEYEGNQKIKVINAALSESEHDIVLHECSDAVSTTDEAHRRKWEGSGIKFTATTTPTLTIDKFQNLTNGFDFLTLDTEGTSYTLFTWMSDEYIRSLKLICIEHDSRVQEIKARMHKLGFRLLLFNGENLIFGK